MTNIRLDRWLALGVLAWFAAQASMASADQQPAEEAQPAEPAAPEPPESAPAGPWAQGVSAEQKAEAQRHLEAGNALFLQSKYQDALDAYERAIAAWDHPAIRFNMVRVLANLGRSVDAYENLDKALQYGDAPLEPQVYAEALTYKQLLLEALAEVELSCEEVGAEVTLDGKPLLTCPGKVVRRISPGPHVVVAKKAQFLTATREEILLPGKRTVMEIDMVPLAEAAVTKRRWAAWKPWAVVGGGVAVAGIGGLFQWSAARNFDAFDQAIESNCRNGCSADTLDPAIKDIESRAVLQNRVAIGLMATGTAAVASGLVLLWMNRAQTYTPTEDAGLRQQPPQGVPPVSLAPTVAPGQVALDLSLRF